MSEDAKRGAEAGFILRHPIYKEAFEALEAKFVTELSHAEISKDRAEYVRTLLVANRKVKSYLEQVMLTGKLEEQHRSLLDRAKAGIRGIVRP